MSDSRERFEAWVSESGRAHLLEREHPHLWYKDLTVTAWWTAWQAALESRVLAERKPSIEEVVRSAFDKHQARCDMGVGCHEAGVCYASAHGEPNRCSLSAPNIMEPVGWIIDWPDEPELGHYYSEEANETARSRPLFTHPTPDDASDAARYRWLREGGQEQEDMFGSVWADSLDAAIDRAMQDKEKQG